MAIHWRIRYAGARYHLTVRGNGCEVVFHSESDYEKFIEQLKNSMEHDDILPFIEETEDEMKAVRLLKSDTGDIVWPEKPRKGLADVLPVVLDGLGLKKTDLKKHGRTLGEKKSMAIELLCQLSSVSQRELTSHFGYSVETSIGKQRKLLVQRFEKDPKARAKYEAVKKHILEKLNASC